MGTCSQPGYVFRDFCLEKGIEFIIFCLNQGIDLSIFVLNWVKCLKQGIKKNRNSVLKWIGKSAIFVLNRVRVFEFKSLSDHRIHDEFSAVSGFDSTLKT